MQVSSSSSIALQLLSNANPDAKKPMQQDRNNLFTSPASRYVAGSSSIHNDLSGVYTDPRINAVSETRHDLAQRFIRELQNSFATDVADFKKQARSDLETALGRSLGENETFDDLGSYTRSTLPEDVLRANRSVQKIDFSFAGMMSRATEINLDTPFLTGRPEELQSLDMSKKEDRQVAVDFAIKFQVMINSSGVRSARQDDVASDMLTKSLEAAGVESDEELFASYADLHRSRFENGEFTVIFNGVKITKDSL